jgi:hypothetical protein
LISEVAHQELIVGTIFHVPGSEPVSFTSNQRSCFFIGGGPGHGDTQDETFKPEQPSGVKSGNEIGERHVSRYRR